jgi:GMP synthase (glutamine-hydrolysing)
MLEKVIILDFGSQYTQLIARRVRELNVYCEIFPFNKKLEIDETVKGIILSGSPFSVRDKNAPIPDVSAYKGKLPLLGICYGAQYLAHYFGGEVMPSSTREYGRAHLHYVNAESSMLKGVSQNTQVWMSHGDTIARIPENYEIIASTTDVKVGAYHIKMNKLLALQFHPEVYHTTEGLAILKNFVVNICGCKQSWTPASFIESTVSQLKAKLGDDKVVLGLSGGVDSSVAAVLIHKAIGKNLTCIFVDNGLLRKDEFSKVLESYKQFGLNVIGVDAGKKFLSDLKGITDPEQKRKIIGRDFIEVFDEESHKIQDVKWLGQGTIYPDVIESVSVNGPSATLSRTTTLAGYQKK